MFHELYIKFSSSWLALKYLFPYWLCMLAWVIVAAAAAFAKVCSVYLYMSHASDAVNVFLFASPWRCFVFLWTSSVSHQSLEALLYFIQTFAPHNIQMWWLCTYITVFEMKNYLPLSLSIYLFYILFCPQTLC